jgi:hypothetical protein
LVRVRVWRVLWPKWPPSGTTAGDNDRVCAPAAREAASRVNANAPRISA